jgi:hypothetical protein
VPVEATTTSDFFFLKLGTVGQKPHSNLFKHKKYHYTKGGEEQENKGKKSYTQRDLKARTQSKTAAEPCISTLFYIGGETCHG